MFSVVDQKKPQVGLFLSANPGQGGTFQYNLAILDAFADLPREQFRLILAYSDPRWVVILREYSLESVYIPMGLLSRVAAFCWRELGLPIALWRKLSKYFQPAARHLQAQQCKLWIFPSQDCWSYQLNIPSLVTVLDLMHRYEPRFPEVSAWGRSRSLERHYRNISRWARGVLVDSVIGQSHMHESYGMPLSKIHVLPYIPPRYIYESKGGDNFDDRYVLPAKYIFYPAQFWTHKNHLKLLQAVAAVKKPFPDIHLVLTGSQKNAYLSVLNEINRLKLNHQVTLLGHVTDADLPEIYRRARALVMPTFFGPTNIPPLEAMALGCPVAVSNIYGMPEQVGEAALLFNPESVEEMSDCILRLWSDDNLCSELAMKGRIRDKAWRAASFNNRFSAIVSDLLNLENEIS